MVISIETRLYPKGWWILVPVSVGAVDLEMVLDTGSPLSSISQRTVDKLRQEGLAEASGDTRCGLRDVKLDGLSIDGLEVWISRRVSALGIDGLIGLSLLGRYQDVHFNDESS